MKKVSGFKFQFFSLIAAMFCLTGLAGSLPVQKQAAFFKTPPIGGGGGGADTPWITAVGSVDGPFNGFNIELGEQVTVGGAGITLTSLGRYAYTGDTDSHVLKLYDSTCTLLGSVSVSMSGSTPGTFVYGTLSPAITLTAGQVYYVMSVETAASGDHWSGNGVSITVTGVATPVCADNQGGGCTAHGGQAEGPVNFKYH